MNEYQEIASSWIRIALKGLFLYYFISGVMIFLMPGLVFDVFGLERSNHDWVVQMCALLTGIFGLIFLVAAKNPYLYRPIVVVGLIAQIAVPVAVSYWILSGSLPLIAALPFVLGDLFWATILLFILKETRIAAE